MKPFFAFLILVGCLWATGCVAPYDVPEFVEIETSESAFLIPLEGDTAKQTAFSSEELLEKQKIAVKRVQIPHRWVQTGRMSNDGEWMDTVRLVKVDRRPVTRSWTASGGTGTSNKNEAVWVESADSVGFSTGFSCTAYVQEKDASKFLYMYTSKSLADVMDSEIRTKIQEGAAEVAAKYDLDDLRRKKQEIIDQVRERTIPFFEQRGITITAIAMFGGFTYENPKVQEAIDKTVQDQQLKVSAEARREAQETENKTIKLAAEAKAEAERIEAEGRAAAIKAVADAKAYEIEKATQDSKFYLSLKQIEVEMKKLEKWDGRYPQYLMTTGGEGGGSPNMLLQVPTIPGEKK